MSPKQYQAYQRVRGTVTDLDEKGAFIQLEPGIVGFLPLSELSWTRQINRPSEVLEVGMEIESLIISLNKDDQKLGLSYRQLEPNPWDEIHLRYPIRRPVRGVVTNINSEIVIVELQEGINGLIDINEVSEQELKVGQIVEAWVIGINKDQHKIHLSLCEPRPLPPKKKINMSKENNHKYKLHMIESWVTYSNKGQVDIDTNYFPILKDKNKDDVAKWVTDNAKNLWIDTNSGVIFPSQTITKQEFIQEGGLEDNISDEDIKDEGWEGDYKDKNREPLLDYFNEAMEDFNKIKNEEHYFTAD
jgi:predicted RNA-binding protein with RPS1 domain